MLVLGIGVTDPWRLHGMSIAITDMKQPVKKVLPGLRPVK
jgi:hypothetical protein